MVSLKLTKDEIHITRLVNNVGDLTNEYALYITNKTGNRTELEQFKEQILSNQEKASYVDYLTSGKTLSKNLVHFINWATNSETFDKLFMDSEFKKNWYPMLRRMEKILEEKK